MCEKEESAKVATTRKHQKLSPCQAQPIPACPNTDLPLAKSEPISDVGGVSVIIYLRKKKTLHKCKCEREPVRDERNSLADTRSLEKEGKYMIQLSEQRFFWSL